MRCFPWSWLSFFLTLALLFTASAQTSTCRAFFSHKSDLWQAMEPVPGLREIVDGFLNDPLTPENLKATVRRGFVAGETDFVRLTEELRREYHVPKKVQARARLRGNVYSIFERPWLRRPRVVMPPTEKRFTVFVEDLQVNRQTDSMLSFIHEMAHIRFELFFEKNLDKIAEKMPPELFRKDAEGRWEVDQQIRSYLHERFAFETEYAAFKATIGSHSREAPEDWKPLLDADAATARLAISNMIIRRYKLRDVRLQSLGHRSLADIFRNGVQTTGWQRYRETIQRRIRGY